MAKTFQDNSGNNSSSRVISAGVIAWACLCLGNTLAMCWVYPEQAIALIAAGGALFTTMTGATFYFLYNQKKTESKL